MVIKTSEFKESDKLIVLFTEKLGKVSVLAKGARKSKSKFLSLSLPFCFGEYVVFKGKNLYTLNEGEPINSFQSLLNDLDSLTVASYLCELIDIAMVEEESNRELFKTFITAFYLIENKAIDYNLILRAFEVKLLAYSGYSLSLENCAICRKRINRSNFISFEFLGGVCDDCKKVNGIHVSYPTYNSLKYLTRTPIENSYRLSLTNETKSELYKLLSIIISENFGRRPNSLETLNFYKGADYNE